MSDSPAPDVERVLRRMGRASFNYRNFPRALEDFAPPPDPPPPEQYPPQQYSPEQYSPRQYPPEPAVVEPLPKMRTAGDHAPAPSMPAAAPPTFATPRPAIPPQSLTVNLATALPARPSFIDNGTPLAAVFGVLSSSLRPRCNHELDARDPPFPFRRR